MSVLIEINNGQPIPLMWYIFILLIFRILALENIAKILTTGHRLGRIALERHECSQHVEISLARPLMSKVETLFVDFKAEIALVYVTKCSN